MDLDFEKYNQSMQTLRKCKDIIYKELKEYEKEFQFITKEFHSECLEIYGKEKNDPHANEFILIRINLIYDADCKELQIPNIFLDSKLRYQGLGKKIIHEVFKVCKDDGYRLFITDLTQSFYTRLVNKGATIIVLGDVVEITDDTDLWKKSNTSNKMYNFDWFKFN